MTPQEAIFYALQNLYTPVLSLSITGSGGSAQGQQYFEQPYLVRQFKTQYYQAKTIPQFTTDTANSAPFSLTPVVEENYTYSMSTEQNNYTYVGANTPAPIGILNDTDCLWWLIPFSTKVNINVQHTATLNPSTIATYPVVFKFQWIGYRLTQNIVNSPDLIYSIIDTLKV